MQQYEILRTIGTGSFARVELARHTQTNQCVAIKVIRKSRTFDLAQQVHTIWEYQILSTLEHPFIVKLYSMSQDEHKLYFMMQYVAGGELFSLMKKTGAMKEIHTVFYSAQMVLALQYLHRKHIIYRALVPENLLIDRRGYLKLTDFGFSKKLRLPSQLLHGFIRQYYGRRRHKLDSVNRNKSKLKLELHLSDADLFNGGGNIYDEFRLDDECILPLLDERICGLIRSYTEIDQTYTLCGTPEYVAPEILFNNGYSCAVDWWSLGVIVHELLTTVTPFASNNKDRGDLCEVYSNIVKQQYTTQPFPPSHLSSACKDVLRGLLTRDPTLRLGSGASGAIDIMSHPFYTGINWVKLLEKKFKKVPWIPSLENEFDTSYFEEYEADPGQEHEEDVIATTNDIFKSNAFNTVHLDNAKYDEECKLVSFMMRQTNTIQFHANGLLNLQQFKQLLAVLQLDDVYDDTVFERIFYFIHRDEDVAFDSRKQVSYITYSDLIGCNYDELLSIIENSSRHSSSASHHGYNGYSNGENNESNTHQDFHVLLSKLVLDQVQWVHDKILDGIKMKTETPTGSSNIYSSSSSSSHALDAVDKEDDDEYDDVDERNVLDDMD